MLERLQEPVAFFLLIMSIILITPLLSERIRLPGMIGIILGGMLIGPHGFHLIEAGDRIEFLATIGLVYLMFSAGLEVDVKQFMRVRSRALVFGLITFSLPQLMGMGLGYLLGLDWLGMILLGSAFASHTLLAFPILTRMGMTRNEAVAVTAGATVLTDIGASTAHVEAMLSGCDALVLECNHDLDLLRAGDYPKWLKERVAGPFGHLDNGSAARLLGALDRSRLKHVVAAHLSQQNNRAELAREALAGAMGCASDWIGLSTQEDGFGWRELK